MIYTQYKQNLEMLCVYTCSKSDNPVATSYQSLKASDVTEIDLSSCLSSIVKDLEVRPAESPLKAQIVIKGKVYMQTTGVWSWSVPGRVK